MSASTRSLQWPRLSWQLWLLPSIAAVAYPFILDAFHAAISRSSTFISAGLLAISFSVPAIGLAAAFVLARDHQDAPARVPALRLAYLSVASPTLFTFLGVETYMLGVGAFEKSIWCAGWAILLVASIFRSHTASAPEAAAAVLPTLRVAHGIAAAFIALFVLFHLANHLFGLIGPEAHAEVMKLGRRAYRADAVQPILIAALLFQIVSGLTLAWRWSARSGDFFRVFQVASGTYLAFFISGHANSVLVFARTYLGVQSDWEWATGGPAGLLHDAWNIRLVPHYWLGVFFVLAHLASGARVVLLAHGFRRTTIDYAWVAGVGMSAIVATLILAGMCGLRIPVSL